MGNISGHLSAIDHCATVCRVRLTDENWMSWGGREGGNLTRFSRVYLSIKLGMGYGIRNDGDIDHINKMFTELW